MDLRTKFVFALVAVALGSMLALGAFTYGSVREMLETTGLEQLDGIAESKKESVEKLFSGWHERVQLIASRTQLRLSLREFERSRDTLLATRIRRILSDAANSVQTVESLAVFDTAGHLVAAVGTAPDAEAGRAGSSPSPPRPPRERSEYRGLVFHPSAPPRLVFVADLVLDGVRLGVLRSTLSAAELLDLIRNYQGLGETGETMIVTRDEDGRVRVIHPVRHTGGLPPGPLLLDDPDDPAALALGGDASRLAQRAIDYRGRPVRAAYRFLPDVGWGLIVKRDEAELHAPVVVFRNQLVQLGTTLAAFAILLGTLLGLAFARPIHQLAGLANRIRAGDLAARADEAREDEIGVLARTFNQMAAELEKQVSELREFNRYFDLSLDMLCIAGMDGYFRKTNPAFERILGWTAEQLRSRPFYDLVHPDDVAATQREVAKLAEGIPTIRFENRYRHADGSYRHLLWTAHPDPASGLMYSAAHDITELKETQAQWESAFVALPAAILGVDAHGTITRATAVAERMLGFETGALIGRPLRGILTTRESRDHDTAAAGARPAHGPPMEPGERWDAAAFAALAGHESDASARRADGARIDVAVRVQPLGGDGRTKAFLSLIDRSATLEAKQRILELAREVETLRASHRTDA